MTDSKDWFARSGAKPMTHSKDIAGLVERAWQSLIEKDDRTSPEDYPDMALITRDELSEIMLAALRPAADPKAEGLVAQLCKWHETLLARTQEQVAVVNGADLWAWAELALAAATSIDRASKALAPPTPDAERAAKSFDILSIEAVRAAEIAEQEADVWRRERVPQPPLAPDAERAGEPDWHENDGEGDPSLPYDLAYRPLYAPQSPAVTEAMVERALTAKGPQGYSVRIWMAGLGGDGPKIAMRAALEAALLSKP